MAEKSDTIAGAGVGLQQSGASTAEQFNNLIQQVLSQGGDISSILGPNGWLGQLMANIPGLTGDASAPLPNQRLNEISQNPLNLPEYTSEGFTKDAMAALLGKNIDAQATAFDNQGAQLKAELARRGIYGGGDQPGSGLAASPLASLYAAKAESISKAIRDAVLANQNQLYLNRKDLSNPTRAIVADFLNNQNKNLLTAGVASNENMLTQNQQDIQRRALGLQALNTGLAGVNTGTDIYKTILSQLGPLVTGQGQGLDVANNALNSRIGLKQADLVNDRTGIANGFMSSLGEGLGAGIGGGLGSQISSIGSAIKKPTSQTKAP